MKVTVVPATVSVPILPDPALAMASTPTVPLPKPLVPAVMVSQLALLFAVQPHPTVVVTVMLALPPAPEP